MTRVSFVIPTLNRGDYVSRAVDSCLVAAREAGVEADIVVLDSESDDGSWEALQHRFAENPSVTLAQNRRGLGPTHSWLDGADLITGDFVTFVWSDDYVAPHFLTNLLPPLRSDAQLSIGHGAIRNIDDVALLDDSSRTDVADARKALEAFLGFHPEIDNTPVSPASALFTRDAFERWKAIVREYSQATKLRQELMWRRAIGPDLLLYLVALQLSGTSHVTFSAADVVQFSVHDGSITVGSPPWLLRAGYWLSRAAAVLDLDVTKGLSRGDSARICARLIVQGHLLCRSIPEGQSGLEDTGRVATLLREEAARIRAHCVSRHGHSALVGGFASLGWRELRRRVAG